MKVNPSSEIEVSIIIRTKNEEKHLEKVLKKILSQKFSRGVEIIIVDSGSEDNTLRIAKKYTKKIVHLFKWRERFSWGGALNVGVENSKGKFIVNLSAHCIPVNDSWLKELYDKIQGSKFVGVGGKQVPLKGTDPFEEVELWRWFPDGEKGTFSNANSIIQKKTLQKYPFNEEVNSEEDGLWEKEMVQRGFNIGYCSAARVYHSHDFSAKNTYRRWYGRGYTMARLFNSKDGKISYFIWNLFKFLVYDLVYFIKSKNFKYIKLIPYYEGIRQVARFKGGRASLKDKVGYRSYFIEPPSVRLIKFIEKKIKNEISN